MASTFSNLKIELIGTGEQSNTWGSTTNTNLGTAIEQALVGLGSVVYASDANLTITLTDTNALQAARALVLGVTSSVSLTATRQLVVPTIQKQYIVQNNTTGSQSITVKTSAGTGVTVPNGRKAHLYVDGTNVIQMFDFVNVSGGTIDNTPIGATTPSTGVFTSVSSNGVTLGRGATAIATNTAVGTSCLAAINSATAANNTAVGYQALDVNVFSAGNTAVGSGALGASVGNAADTFYGGFNTAIGYRSLATITGVSQFDNGNTAIGTQAAENATITRNSVYIGNQTGQSVTGLTSDNIAIGNSAFQSAGSSSSNVVIGTSAFLNPSGTANTAIGHQSMYGFVGAGTSPNYNACLGGLTLYSITSGDYNIAIGYGAGQFINSGSGNIVLGRFNAAGTAAPVFNVTTENDRIALGTTAVTNAYVQVAWTVVSDARDKTDFAEVPHGLDFVCKLNPIAYRFKMDRESTEGHGPLRYGFKAQDILELEGDTPVIIDNEDPEKLRFNDHNLIAVLTKAIQELKAEFDAYKASKGE